MSAPADFEAFAKIARLNRDVVITEKIDGTNAQVFVHDDGTVQAGSRNRWLTPESDNHGFARWVAEHAEQLRALGPGRHFGEWWGSGIQRGYGLKNGDKRFSLFNVHRWADPATRPACCHVVPTLDAAGRFGDAAEWIDSLRRNGSVAVPGFMRPEGIVLFHTASGVLFKVTLDGDNAPKGLVSP